MAKKKLPVITSKVDIHSLIEKKMGFGGLIKNAKDFKEEDYKTIQLSPAHDLALGGIDQGSTMIVAGKSGAGKTSTIVHLCKKCQQAGMHVYFFNIEHRLKKRDLELQGLDPDRFDIIESTKEKHLLGHDFLNIATEIMKATEECVFVLDSISMLAEAKTANDGVETSSRGAGAQVVSRFMINTAGIIKPRKHILIGTYHVIANTSGYGAAFMEKGGNSGIYKADVRLTVKSFDFWEVGEQTVGQRIVWKVLKTAHEGEPNKEYESWLRYGYGIDETKELFCMAESIGYIKKAGAWYSFDEPESEKFQGEDKILTYIRDNPEVFNRMKGKISEFFS